MIESTKDIFWLVAAFSLAFFTFFVCWTMYYCVMMLRDASKVIASIKQKIELVDTILHLIQEKLEKTSSHLSLISESIMKVAGFFMDRESEKKERKKK